MYLNVRPMGNHLAGVVQAVSNVNHFYFIIMRECRTVLSACKTTMMFMGVDRDQLDDNDVCLDSYLDPDDFSNVLKAAVSTLENDQKRSRAGVQITTLMAPVTVSTALLVPACVVPPC